MKTIDRQLKRGGALFVAALIFAAPLFGQEYEELKRRVEKIEAAVKLLVEKEKGGAATAVAEKKKEAVDFEALIARLKQGNERFVAGKTSRKDLVKRRAELASGQRPYAIIVCCADSRVPPELLFDESLGQLFVVRSAGNVLDSVAIGSIEYAVEHLHAPLLAVVGHTSCGAVKAAAAGGHLPSHLPSIVTRLQSAVDAGKKKTADENALVGACVEENVRIQLARLLKESSIVKEAVENNHLKVVGSVYHLDDGKAEFLQVSHEPLTANAKAH
jgi:carbonic anhydrase